MAHIQKSSRLDYHQAHFFISASTVAQCPADDGMEVAFIGRSNAGKSSAINRLTDQHKLARTSKTPGRTQLLNFFEITEGKYLVDLPGFGYAKVAPEIKRKWQRQLELYLQERQSLRGLVLLVDIRHPFKEFDQRMIDWAHKSEMPLHLLLTKSDKLKHGAAKTAFLTAQKHLTSYGDRMSLQLFSSLKGVGVKELSKKLDQWLVESESEE
jgi:GTP-binding protein